MLFRSPPIPQAYHMAYKRLETEADQTQESPRQSAASIADGRGMGEGDIELASTLGKVIEINSVMTCVHAQHMRRNLFAKSTGLIRSHKTIKVASSNSAQCESSQGPVLRGNTNRGNARKPAWGYAC